MPLPLVEAMAAAMPRLQAEEAIALSAAVAAGTGSLSDEGKAAWAEVTRAAHTRPSPAVPRAGRRDVPVMRLAAMGTRVELRKRKG